MEHDAMPDVLRRFLRYVQIHTTSAENVNEIPSTKRQFDLARELARELREIGVHDVSLDDHCIVIATIPSNLGKTRGASVPTICFIAHVDTSPEEPGEHVKPRLLTYTGGTITFPGDASLSITPEETPELASLIGEQLVTSDGTTLLGADDKAGVAEIMAAASHVMHHPEVPHGTIKLIFTPDEEVGNSVDKLDLKLVNAAFGYTLDGDELGVIEAECFNAVSATIKIKGYNVHPGYANGKMVNAARITRDVLQLFPDDAAPETTKDREGYMHPNRVEGNVNEAKVNLLLRDFDRDALEAKMQAIKNGVSAIQDRWPRAKIDVEFKEGYRNMKEIIDLHPRVVEIASEAIRRAGIEPLHRAIRGGTDGARLCFMGLPCPNLFAGGMNFHSKKEFVPVSWMEKAVQMILNIIDIVATGRE